MSDVGQQPGNQPQQYGGQPPAGQPQYGGQPPGQQPYGQAYAQQRGTNTMAILSLVFAFVFWPLGIIFGFIAKRQIRDRGEGGSGLATAGIVLGFVFLALTIVYVIAIVALVSHSGTTSGTTGY
ncbi:MAG: DUF4190 domain-containing protein [Actinomycetota bacterium]|nr:DUF4190 domain-containing protein [Actinomycetota bacterium]